ncbi:MAG: hypothetical protein C5B60_09155 [Chloroflexi bacterium]|nr:MAG: hypothetical protein C5B60_09155 [Chloroflexota bacterium]
MCKVCIVTTLDETTIHIEEFAHPESLLFAAEGEDPRSVNHQAWVRYLRRHPERSVKMLDLHFQPGLPPWRLQQAIRASKWLLEQIVRERAA